MNTYAGSLGGRRCFGMEVMIEGDLLESKEELFEIGDESQIALLWLLFPISIKCF